MQMLLQRLHLVSYDATSDDERQWQTGRAFFKYMIHISNFQIN